MQTNGEFNEASELDSTYSWLADEYVPQTTIRNINADDKNKILEIDFIRAKELDEYPLQDVEELNKYLLEKNGNTACFVATAAKDMSNVVGYILYNINKKSITILRFAVHPQWCGFGRGTILVQKVLEIARQRAGKVTVSLSPKCEHAKNILFDLNFNFQMGDENWQGVWTSKTK